MLSEEIQLVAKMYFRNPDFFRERHKEPKLVSKIINPNSFKKKTKKI